MVFRKFESLCVENLTKNFYETSMTFLGSFQGHLRLYVGVQKYPSMASVEYSKYVDGLSTQSILRSGKKNY
jgi:hypothetical protein